LQTGTKCITLDARFPENTYLFFGKVCRNKKRLYLCSPFDLKKGIKKFFEKIEASLAEANAPRLILQLW
jgi:hypothetical protein